MRRSHLVGSLGLLVAGCASGPDITEDPERIEAPARTETPPEGRPVPSFGGLSGATRAVDVPPLPGPPAPASGCAPGCPDGLSCVKGACVGVVDFERVPGGAPSDGATIDEQFRASFGVSFGLDADGDGKPDPGRFPVLAERGAPCTAFFFADTCDTGPADPEGGRFFLTDDGTIGAIPPALVVTYASPVSGAYAQILDVDEPEAWTIDACDADGDVIDSVRIASGDPGTGDGVATPFAFKHAKADIHALRIYYSGAPVAAVGLAFDNFSPASDAPPPGQPPAPDRSPK